MKEIIFQKKFLILLFLSFFIFLIYFSYLSIRRVYTLNSYYYDLGIMDQVVYNTSRGRFLEMTNPTFLKNISRLAIHFDPILAFFAPFYLIYPSFIWLLVLQVLIVGLGAFFLFFLGKKILKNESFSLLISILYLLNFTIERMVLFDFHAVSLATTFFIASFYFLEEKKWFWFYFSIFLTLLTKEHIGLIIVFFSLYLFLFKKEKKKAVFLFILGLVFFIGTTFFIIPYFREGKEHFALSYFLDIKKRLPTIFNSGFSYLLRLISPLFFSLLAPEVFLIALPELAINILSKNENMRAIYFHYHAVIIAFLFVSLIYGISRLERLVKSSFLKKSLFLIFLILNVYSIYLYNPFSFLVKQKVVYKDILKETKQSIFFWQKKIEDENISLATTPKLAPFFTQRKYYYNFLFDPAWYSLGYSDEEIYQFKKDTFSRADYIIIYKKEIGLLNKKNAKTKLYNLLLADKNFKLIYNKGEIEVYKKVKNI